MFRISLSPLHAPFYPLSSFLLEIIKHFLFNLFFKKKIKKKNWELSFLGNHSAKMKETPVPVARGSFPPSKNVVTECDWDLYSGLLYLGKVTETPLFGTNHLNSISLPHYPHLLLHVPNSQLSKSVNIIYFYIYIHYLAGWFEIFLFHFPHIFRMRISSLTDRESIA